MAANPVDLLFPAYRRQVLGLLLLRPDEGLHVREISRLTGVPAGSLHRELRALAEAGVLEREPVGNQVLYRADRGCPVYAELASMFRKSAGSAEAPRKRAGSSRGQASEGGASGKGRRKAAQREAGSAPGHRGRHGVGGGVTVSHAALTRLARRYHIRRVALFGSAARGELGPDSDVDLLVEFEPGQAPSLWEQQELEESFSRLFAGRRVDIAPPGILRNPHRRRSIEREMKVLYEAA